MRTRSKVQKRGAGRRMVEVMGREGERVRREVRGRVEAPAREPVRRKVSWRWRGGDCEELGGMGGMGGHGGVVGWDCY